MEFQSLNSGSERRASFKLSIKLKEALLNNDFNLQLCDLKTQGLASQLTIGELSFSNKWIKFPKVISFAFSEIVIPPFSPLFVITKLFAAKN